VGDAKPGAGADRDAARPGEEKDANVALRRPGESGARVVVGEDPLVAVAVQREALGAVLAHADSVAVAAAGDHEDRRRRQRVGAERARGKNPYEQDKKTNRTHPQTRPRYRDPRAAT